MNADITEADAGQQPLQKAVDAALGRASPVYDDMQGIVTCAGGVRLFTNAYVLIRTLRETLNCDLPIQLWHFGGEELSSAMRRILLDLSVEIVDVEAVLRDFPARISDGWQLKAYAILHSRFSEVLFLDADQVPVRNPAEVFSWPEYQREGAIFWPDIVELRADNAMWAALEMQGEQTTSFESGQILVDKRRHLAALKATLALNERADVVYRHIYGDKDTFLFGWRAVGAAFALVPHRPFIDDRVLVQRDFDGAPMFQHLTGGKFGYGVAPLEIDGLQGMEACKRFLTDLEGLWNGRIFFPPDRSLAARAEEDRLALLGPMKLELIGDHDVTLEFRAGHELGLGRSVERQNWFVADEECGLVLFIVQGQRPVLRLQQVEAGTWEGALLSMQRSPAVMYEPADGPDAKAGGARTLLDDLITASGVGAAGGGEPGTRHADLVAALGLLLRAEPGLRARLGRMAEGPEPSAKVARDVLAENAPLSEVTPDKNAGVLGTGYSRPEDKGL